MPGALMSSTAPVTGGAIVVDVVVGGGGGMVVEVVVGGGAIVVDVVVGGGTTVVDVGDVDVVVVPGGGAALKMPRSANDPFSTPAVNAGSLPNRFITVAYTSRKSTVGTKASLIRF